MKKAYVVTQGCYSDYGIVGVFTSRAKARQFLDSFPKAFPDARIEEYAVNFELPARDMWEVTIRPDGSKVVARNISHEFRSSDFGSYFLSSLSAPPSWSVRDVKPGSPPGCCVTDASFTVTCFPRDEEHGLKIARDAMRGVIAHGLWKHDATGPLS